MKNIFQFNKKSQSDFELSENNQALCLLFENVIQKSSEIILDKENEIRTLMVALLAKGHILIEDIPGVGKTTLAQTLAKLLGLPFNRVQFTNDLLPSDIIGNMIFNAQKNEFYFHAGPLFSEFVLGDELNRANPKTQSALLEALEEGQVSIDSKVFTLPQPFFFVATQNPHFQVGTFPLPESQLDRFLIGIDLNYATKQGELKIFMGFDSRKKLAELTSMIQKSDLLQAQDVVSEIFVSEKLAEYIYNLIQTSRNHSEHFTPLSTRAGLSLVKACQAYAFLNRRGYVMVEDVKAVAPFVLSHRLGLQNGIKVGQQKVKILIEMSTVPI